MAATLLPKLLRSKLFTRGGGIFTFDPRPATDPMYL